MFCFKCETRRATPFREGTRCNVRESDIELSTTVKEYALKRSVQIGYDDVETPLVENDATEVTKTFGVIDSNKKSTNMCMYTHCELESCV